MVEFVALGAAIAPALYATYFLGTKRSRTIEYEEPDCIHEWGKWKVAEVTGSKAVWGQTRNCTKCGYTIWKKGTVDR